MYLSVGMSGVFRVSVHTYTLKVALRCLPPMDSCTSAPLFSSHYCNQEQFGNLGTFSFSTSCFFEQGMAGATLRNIPEEKTDGWTNSSNTQGSCLGYRYKQGLGFLFCWDTFSPRQGPIRDRSAEFQPRLYLFNNAVG